MLRRTKTQRAGLTMSVARIERNLRGGRYAKRIGTGAAVYLAAVLEYLSAEVLELSGNECHADQKKLIKPRHLMMAIEDDSELKVLLKDVTLPESGVRPWIQPVLLSKSSKKNSSNN